MMSQAPACAELRGRAERPLAVPSCPLRSLPCGKLACWIWGNFQRGPCLGCGTRNPLVLRACLGGLQVVLNTFPSLMLAGVPVSTPADFLSGGGGRGSMGGP